MKFKVKKQHRLKMYVVWGVHADRGLIAGFKLDLSVPDSNYKNQNLFIMFYFNTFTILNIIPININHI